MNAGWAGAARRRSWISIQANRRSGSRTPSAARLPNAAPFGSRERVFFAEEIEHRSLDSVLRVGFELQSARTVEAVHSLD